MSDPASAPDRVAHLLTSLDLDEKASLTAGDDAWHLPAIARIGLGRIMMSDGPSGVRGSQFGTIRSLSYPCGLAIGATWDLDLVARYGAALAEEAHTKGVHLLLGPTVCIPRTPLAGRTFESFSEDPELSARLAATYVAAVQAGGVGCCVKHFACNDQEHDRLSVSARVDEITLREVHLAPFEAAVTEAGVWAVMAAYNRLNGTWCSEHGDLLGTILTDEWGFDGVVVSDWSGTHSTVAAAEAGLDVEMPAPARHFGPGMAEAVRAGDLDEAVVDDKARRILTLAARTGALGGVGVGVESEDDDPRRRALARDLATASFVLLTNDGILPLEGAPSRLALIGPNAERPEGRGGGSSTVTAFDEPSLAEALAARLPRTEVTVHAGCSLDLGLPPIPRWMLGDGMAVEYFADPDFSGAPAATATVWGSRLVSIGDPAPGVSLQRSSMRVTASLLPDTGGDWRLGITNTAPTRVFLDGTLVIDNTDFEPSSAFFGLGSRLATAEVELVAGRAHSVVVEMVVTTDRPVAGFELYGAPTERPDLFGEAVAAAAAADVAVVVVGSNERLETEGHDRTDLALPGGQDELVRRVVAANPRTIVVVNTGAPVTMPWADDAAAVLMAWYPGEEGAGAIADVLVGAAEPAGRLPITFPAKVEDTAAHGHYPGADGEVVYDERLAVGYRHFDADGIEPLFAFGHGLSYTTFALGTPAATGHGTRWRVTVPVTNTGARTGSTVVQAYVGRTDAAPGRPLRELKGFAKVTLDPGATTDAVIAFDDRSFARWDPPSHDWVVDPGTHDVWLGLSSRDLRCRVPLTVS